MEKNPTRRGVKMLKIENCKRGLKCDLQSYICTKIPDKEIRKYGQKTLELGPRIGEKQIKEREILKEELNKKYCICCKEFEE